MTRRVRPSRPGWRALPLLFALATGLGCQSSQGGVAPATPPRLVVVIAVDQLIRERLDPALPGGLGRIAREGRVFTDAAHQHARTETCPGHVVILTGRQPGRCANQSWVHRQEPTNGRIVVARAKVREVALWIILLVGEEMTRRPGTVSRMGSVAVDQ